MVFPSKKDWWMRIVIWGAALLLIIPPVFFPNFGVWMTPAFLDKQWIKVIILGFTGILLLWIWFKTNYTVEEKTLKITCGPFKKKVKIDDIRSIRQTKDPFTAPALSMDKLEINYDSFKIIAISPKDKQTLIHHLLKQNPNIEIK
ncbi:PH domain-containing protein [Oceanobacillus oncorhynchi subsp. oncorhynchi]|uniref:PH domain-containing protein n=1 Tax=Oceanobacillus TaxID=182709 RepID=UPI0030D8B34F